MLCCHSSTDVVSEVKPPQLIEKIDFSKNPRRMHALFRNSISRSVTEYRIGLDACGLGSVFEVIAEAETDLRR